MTGKMRGSLLLGLVSLAVAQPARAAETCWNNTETAAAKVRDLQSRLMVAALRCRAGGIDILSAYNDFVRVNRSTLQAANDILRAQFDSAHGPGAGQREYDSFATALANAYGAGETSVARCAEVAAVAVRGVGAAGEIAALVALDEGLGATPGLPGGECPITFAAIVK